MIERETIERFIAKVQQPANGHACWRWRGSTRSGYACMSINNKTISCHRLSWEIHHRAPWPTPLIARHTCDNPWCVNPEHIVPGTYKENRHDAIIRNRGVGRKAASVCKNGHDVSKPDLVYFKNGHRSECRECAKRRSSVRYRIKKTQ